MVTNTTVLASTSVSGAVATIDAALRQCSERIQSLQAQGRTHLDVYTSLVDKFETLKRRRKEFGAHTAEVVA